MFNMPSPPTFSSNFPALRCAKQLLLVQAHSDIAQKHPASRFAFTTGRGGQWETVMKEWLK